MNTKLYVYFILSAITFIFNYETNAYVDRNVYETVSSNTPGSYYGVSATRRKKICEHDQDDSGDGIVERILGGETAAEKYLGNEKTCLQQAGLLINNKISSDSLIGNSNVNQFYNQCIYNDIRNLPIEGIQELVEQTNEVLGANHIRNRDLLINGFWQDLARRSQGQLLCRQRAISMAQTNQQARARLVTSAEKGFENIVDKVRALMIMKKASLKKNQEAVLNQFGQNGGCRGLAWIFCSDVVKERTTRDNDIYEKAIAAEISKLPYGHEIDVLESVIKMADTGTFDPDAFVGSLSKTFERYEKLVDYYHDRYVVTDTKNNKGLFCIDSAFKEFAASSGVTHKLLTSLGRAKLMDSETANIINCRINSKYKETTQNIDSFNNGLFLVGGGATAILTALPSGGGSLAAFATAASLGVSAASLSYQIKRAHAECTKQEFLISPEGGSEICEPEKDFDKELDKFSPGSCALEAGLAAVELIPIPFDLQNLVRASRGTRVSNLMKDVEVVSGTSKANNEIIVTASKSGKSSSSRLFLAGDNYENTVESLGRKGIKLDNNVSIEAPIASSLSLTERAAIFEYVSNGAPLTATQANKLSDLFFQGNSTQNWKKDHRNRLERFLKDTGVEDGDIATTAENILGSGVLGNKLAVRKFSENISDLPEAESLALIRSVSGIDNIDTKRTRDILAQVELDPSKANDVLKIRMRRKKLRSAFQSDVREPELTRMLDRMFESGALGRVPQADVLSAVKNAEIASGIGRAPASLTNVTKELKLSINLNHIDIGGEVKKFASATKNEINNKFSNWPEEFSRDALAVLKNETLTLEERTKYLAMLLNSGDKVPTNTLVRIKKLINDPTDKPQIVSDLQKQVNDLSTKIDELLDSGNELEILNLSRERSGLLTEKFLIESGDDIEITSIFSSNAYNKDFAANPGRQPHSLSDTFNLDFKVKEGSRLEVCRGSFAGKSSYSGVIGGFLTVCSSANYAGRRSIGNRNAAPATAELGGYNRLNKIELRAGDEISFGQNGKVFYTEGEIAGSGGFGGDVEFFVSRANPNLSLDNLITSVRVPKCDPTNPACKPIFSLQESISARNLKGSTSQNDSILASAQNRAMKLAESFEEDALSTLLKNQQSGKSASEALEQFSSENPRLYSALTVAREAELKRVQLFNNGVPSSKLDRETLRLVRLTEDASRSGKNFDAGEDSLNEFIDNSLVITAVRDNRREINEAYASLAKADNVKEQREIMRELVILKNQQQDTNLALRTFVSNVKRSKRGVNIDELENVISASIRTNPANRNASANTLRTEEDFVDGYWKRGLTEPEQNREFIDLAMREENTPGLFFVDSQNQLLKSLNDNLKNKPLIDALGNRHSEIINEAILSLKRKYPGLKVTPYSDYKGVRFAILSDPPGSQTQMMDELKVLLDEADAKFMQELKQEKFTSLRGKIDEEQWFSTSIAKTADEANVQARFKPGTSWDEINQVWLDVNTERRRLENTLGNTPLMRAVPGSSAKIPTEEVFAILRKKSDPAEVRAALNKKFKTNISLTDSKDLIAYYEQIDFFSPGLMIDKRVVHDFTDAKFGVITGDIRNLGARNLTANAEGMSRGLRIEQSILRTRKAEQLVTKELNEFKNASENAIKTVLARHDIDVRVTVSGDDLVAVPNKPLTQEIKEEILLAQSRAGVPSDMRISFTSSDVKNPKDAAIIAVEGEGFEKQIRASLEMNELFSEAEMSNLIIAADMKGLQAGEGPIGLIVNPGLNPKKLAAIKKTYEEVVGARLGDFRVIGSDKAARETAASFIGKPQIRFMRAGEPESTITENAFTPGKGYVAIIHDGKLVIGENFVGNSGNTKGSHVTLKSRLTGIKMSTNYEGQGGSIRVNYDGSIDISGYHLTNKSEKAAKRIQKLILQANPNAVTRITGDRLSALE